MLNQEHAVHSPGSTVVTMFERILTVCVGNICRSPTAEYLLRHRLGTARGAQVTSAGLGALVDRPIDPTALAILAENGIPGGEHHRARQATSDILRSSDLILVMEKSHAAKIGQIAPEVSGKVFVLDKWLEAKDIPDPYRQERPAFEHVYTLIDRGVSSWLRYL